MLLNIHPCIETILPEEQTQAMYEYAVQAFLKLKKTWVPCPCSQLGSKPMALLFPEHLGKLVSLSQWLF